MKDPAPILSLCSGIWETKDKLECESEYRIRYEQHIDKNFPMCKHYSIGGGEIIAGNGSLVKKFKSQSGDRCMNLSEPYNKFSALLAKKICYLRLLSSSAGSGPPVGRA